MKSSRPAPTTGQGIFGIVVLLGFALIPLWWASDESGGARVFLWILSAMFFVLALFRAFTTYRLAARGKETASS